MRKLILISAFVLASASVSVSAQAADGRGPAQAANGTAAANAAGPQASGQQAARPQKFHVKGYEAEEAKARRIAAKYGISW